MTYDNDFEASSFSFSELDVSELLKDLVSICVRTGEKGGVDDIAVMGESYRNNQVRFARNEVSIVKQWNGLNLQVFVSFGRKIAMTQINQIDRDVVRGTVEKLVVLCKAMKENEGYFGIAEGPFSYDPIPKTFDPKICDLREKAIDLVEGGINSALEEGAKRAAGVFYFGERYYFIQTNRGVEKGTGGTFLRFTIRAFVDELSSGQGINVSCCLEDFDAEKAGVEAGQIAKLAVNSEESSPGKYDLLLNPTVGATFLGATVQAANPFWIESGLSWLGGKVGEKIGSGKITAYDDGRLENGLNSMIFDDEGVPTQKTTIIEEGILKGLIHNTSTAKRYNAKSTGNAGIISPQPSNIVFEPGDYSFEELLNETGNNPMLYITSTRYTRFMNRVEGTFSSIPRDGMFLIKNGEIWKPIRGLRVSDNILNIFKNTVALSKERQQIKWWEVTTPIVSPFFLVRDCMMSKPTK
ncbi:MAG: TldD/PmbA family protein [Candidatus Hodarchaeota archaeon]